MKPISLSRLTNLRDRTKTALIEAHDVRDRQDTDGPEVTEEKVRRICNTLMELDTFFNEFFSDATVKFRVS